VRRRRVPSYAVLNAELNVELNAQLNAGLNFFIFDSTKCI